MMRFLKLFRGGAVDDGRRENAMLTGRHGQSTVQDRGAHQGVTTYSSNPYFFINEHQRWQEYTRLYMTAWEARKIIDIPVDDALRKPFEPRGLDDADAEKIMRAYEDLDADVQLRRALVQERLYGGAVLFPVLRQPGGTSLDSPLALPAVAHGDLMAFNVIDISCIQRQDMNNDPFSPDYDRALSYNISGVPVHASRLIVLDGSPLLNRVSRTLLGSLRSNSTGFGESKIAPIYDLLIRVTGTQQGAYHLVNMASVLLVEVEKLTTMGATCSPALEHLRDLAEQISIYRAGILDNRAKLSQHNASFGGVPELVMSFAQLLAAASDISATRFLGQSPNGLNSTGESDTENYYNMVDSYTSRVIKPVRRRMLDFIGASLWGPELWQQKSARLELHHPSLWNLSDQEQSQVDNTYAGIIATLVGAGVLGGREAIEELKARDIFKTDIEAEEFLNAPPSEAENPANPEESLEALRAMGGSNAAV